MSSNFFVDFMITNGGDSQLLFFISHSRGLVGNDKAAPYLAAPPNETPKPIPITEI